MKFKPSGKFELIAERDFTSKLEQIKAQLKAVEQSKTIIGKGNCKISCKFYLAENAEKSIVILHGFTEFIEKYEELIFYFLNLGFNVFGYDQRGHGYSGREVEDITTTHVNSFDDYVSDLEQVMDELVLPTSKGLPVCIFSHSMGGAVAMLYLQRHSEIIERALLSSPLISPQTASFPDILVKAYIKKHAAADGWSAQFIPTSSRNSKPDQKLLTDKSLSIARFRQVLNYHMNVDAYKNQFGSNRWIYEALCLKKKILNKAKLKKIKTKVLIISAECDTVVKTKPQLILSQNIPNCRLITIKNAKHTIFTCATPILEEYYKAVFDFLCN